MLRFLFLNFVGVLLIFFSTPSLAKHEDPKGAGQAETESLENLGHRLFLHYCAHCHGIKGEGDGFNSEFLEKEPAELADTRFVKKKTNKQLFKVINLGGIGVRKSNLMPGFGNTLSEKEIWALVAYIRKLANDDETSLILPEQVNSSRPESAPLNTQDLERFMSDVSDVEKKESLNALGEKMFFKKKSCSACHRLEDEGGKVGPDLSRAGFLYKPEWLFLWMKNPQKIRPQTKMPNLGLNQEEATALASFLSGIEGSKSRKLKKLLPYLEKKGDAQKGKELFFDPEGKANCSKCHTIGGNGGNVGPDLSFIGTSRTTPFILESIVYPKEVITIGYSSVMILTHKGKFLTGIKKLEDDSSLTILDKEGNLLKVTKSEIKKFKTQKISIMPGNFRKILSVEDIQNILAFLEQQTLPLTNKEKP